MSVTPRRKQDSEGAGAPRPRRRAGPGRRLHENATGLLADDPLWFKDAIFYEVHVRAFTDGSGDGNGDFIGLASRLDYIRDLGVTAIWVLPFYPSPLKDDGYDIAEYTDVHPDYGTLADFRFFLREAHRRGLRVVTELVLNHTSDRHPWFQRARRAGPGSVYRDFYVWSDTPDRFRGTRIIFKDFEGSNWTHDPVAKAYYWHRFYHHQPDLNYDNPAVMKSMLRVMDFWLDMGVDGLRLDAVPYLIEREGTSCENLAETHERLRDLRRHVDENHKNRMLLAEANQWPEDAVAYFGRGDECQMAFHFPLMPRMFMGLRMEDRYPILDILSQTPTIPENCQWALFLRNHDELTLEMVTDEERDYMYRVYAHDSRARINLGIRRRLAPLLGNDRRRIELMNGLLLSLPGTPVLYYGDEIGMGDNIYLGDRNGVRTPMQWSADRNAGFSAANAQSLYLPVIIDPDFHYESVNVDAALNNPHSLLWWTRRLIALRKRHRAFGRGSLEFLAPENRKVLAFVRRYEEEIVLVVANLSRFAQYVELDLSAYRGRTPRELFGSNAFPTIGELPYLLTLGPHAFYWFSLEMKGSVQAARARVPEKIEVGDAWEGVFEPGARQQLETVLAEWLPNRRWFGGKSRTIKLIELTDVIRVPMESDSAVLAMAHVQYVEGEPEKYLLPLAFATGERALRLESDHPQEVVARLVTSEGAGILHDAIVDRTFTEFVLDAIAHRRHFRGLAGIVSMFPMKAYRRLRGSDDLTPSPSKAEQSNTSVVYGDRLILKLFRKVEPGPNPDLEIGAFLTERAEFPHAPPVAGAIEYRPARGERNTLGVLNAYVPNSGDAWEYTLDHLEQFFESAAASDQQDPPPPPGSPLERLDEEPPSRLRAWAGVYMESARLLGDRTAELHLALASDPDDPTFAPEPFTLFYQRSLYQSMRNLANEAMHLLRARLSTLDAPTAEVARAVLQREKEILARMRAINERPLDAIRIRIHGDFHLGQVLYAGRDFVITDFEGEPALAMSARRIKRSPLRDVAGMLRSFHYAALQALNDEKKSSHLTSSRVSALEAWAAAWSVWIGRIYLRRYLDKAAGGPFLPKKPEDVRKLLDVFLTEKAVYELSYELNNRPEWVIFPLRGILGLLEAKP